LTSECAKEVKEWSVSHGGKLEPWLTLPFKSGDHTTRPATLRWREMCSNQGLDHLREQTWGDRTVCSNAAKNKTKTKKQ
jgi:hypothetical protein